jgi:4-amino-4-deoxy-L-arabinose transferase-like glycosyltransferase
MKNFPLLKKREWHSWAPELLAILGVLLYLIQAWRYAHTTIPGLDEGSYLFKGYLYLHGVYEPFEPYGPLTNKAPLAFLIPGIAQYIFGTGLRTGRFFAIFLGLLAILGTWITARRWAGKWLATASVWVFALSPMVIKIHAITASEVIIACMLAWMCVFFLAEERSLWQIVLGSALGAFAVLTRQNMVVVLPLLILYVFWQHGKQKGIASFVSAAIVFLAFHIYYWPNILTIWAPWLPDGLTPFLNPFRLPQEAVPVWDPSIDFWNRTIAFFQGIRYHFIPVLGSIFALMLWSRPRDWKTASAMRAAIFLALTYFTLFAMHAWAAVASQYESYSCVYCFTPYLSFFDPLGILLSVITISSSLNRKPSRGIQVLAILLILVLSTGIGLSSFDNIGRVILAIPVPRMSGGQFLPGTTTLVEFITNKFGTELTLLKRYLASVLGLLAGIAALLTAFAISRRMKDSQMRPGFAFVLLNFFLAMGLLLSPALNAGGSRTDCEQDMLMANEQVGAQLASLIPADSLVYWDGGLSFTPMLYVPQARIFPPQINDGYSYRIGGDADTLARFSHWNNELKSQWKASADIFIIQAKRYTLWKDFLNPKEFEEYPKPATAPSCEEGSELRIFHRLP